MMYLARIDCDFTRFVSIHKAARRCDEPFDISWPAYSRVWIARVDCLPKFPVRFEPMFYDLAIAYDRGRLQTLDATVARPNRKGRCIVGRAVTGVDSFIAHAIFLSILLRWKGNALGVDRGGTWPRDFPLSTR